MTDLNRGGNAVLGALIGLGLAVGGYFIGEGLLRARSADRFVTVKGLAEREVAANLVIWPITYTVTADDLGTLQQRTDDGAAKIRAFLADDFEDGEIGSSAARVSDRQAQGMMGQGRLERFVAESTVTVRTPRIETVRSAMERTGELVKQGVALIRSYENSTEYLYTSLNEIKPEMIQEATKDARRAAQQFAEDSGSRVGGIRNAQQGYFSITDRDAFSPEFKKVRVVTTVQYFLEDD
ncbi:MAG: SIMPL domain-containing protein [Thermoanaerobaculales bacterium]|nr:SIMPL domain-containing protein [Thermoanaerobaculales bacterium]